MLEESTTRAGLFLEVGSDTGSDIFPAELIPDADTLREGDLDIDSDIFLEELNIGSGFIQFAA